MRVFTVEPKTPGIYTAALSPNGQLALSAGGEGAVSLWDMASGRSLATIAGFDAMGSYHLAFSPDGSLAIASQNGGVTFRVRCQAVAASSGNPAYSLAAEWYAVSRDGSLAVGRSESFVDYQLFDPRSGMVFRTLPPTEAPNRPGAFAFSEDGTRLLVPHSVVDTRSGEILVGPGTGAMRLQCMAMSPDGRLVLGANVRDPSDTRLLLWDIDAGKEHVRLEPSLPPSEFIGGTDYPPRERWQQVWHKASVFSHDGRHLTILEDWEGLDANEGHAILRMWDTATGRQVRPFGDRGGLIPNAQRISLSPNGKHLLTTRELWEVESGRLLCRFGVTSTTYCLNDEYVLGDMNGSLAAFQIPAFPPR